jgi:TolB-like protein/Flp pilus assembly protein TadD
MLYEMLGGTAPFTGPTAQAIMAQLFTEPIAPLHEKRAEVPDWVDTAVQRALAKQPGERWDTPSAFAQALSWPAGGSTPPGSPAGSATKSIAVLPFVNMSTDPENEYFTDGIAEEIINALSRIQSLRVAPRIASFAFKGKQADVGEIGRKLRVGTVLDGSVRKAGNRLRITVQLVNVADGNQLWTERYDRQLEDVFAIQDEIADAIVKALRVVLSPEEKRAIERAPTENVRAYEYYLRGRQYFHQWRRKAIEYARQMFERAIEIDPNYALAYAGVADCCAFTFNYWDASAPVLAQADAASRRALELAPDLPEVHVSRGLALAFSRRFPEAETEFRAAISLNPKLYEAHYFFGRALQQQGKAAEAVRSFEEACRLRPDDYQASAFLAQAYDSLGVAAQSDAIHRRALQLVERHIELNPEDSRALNVGATLLVNVHGAAGGAKAREWNTRALAADPEDSGMLYNVACVYARLGEEDEAIECLDRAVRTGFGLREWLENDPDFASVRDDPRFQAILAKM